MTQNKKIKVLFRHRSMEMGGVEKVLLSMLNNLDREKFDLSLALNLYQGELREQIPSHVNFKTMAGGKEDFPKNSILNKLALISRGLKLLAFRIFPSIADKFILKNDADVEIATGYTMFSDVLNSSNKKSKKIGWFHSDITSSGFKPILPKLLEQIPQFDYFIFGSQQAKDIMEETYPELNLPTNSVILNAIPIEEIKAKAEEFEVERSESPVFVSVGRLHNRKGYHLLIDAHKKLLNDGLEHKIMVIGDGEERQNLEKQIAENQVADSFLLLGTLLNPYPYVKNSDYYIIPSRSEGWPLIIAETLILQKPVIATNVGGIPEMIINEENGILVDYNTESIYEGMKRFLTDPELISKIKSNLTKSEEQFDSKKIFNAVEEILLKLIH